MIRTCSVSPVLPVLAAFLVTAAAAIPALANQNSSELPEAETAHDGLAPVDGNALPSNDLSTSMASKISTPAAPGGSLHASPKILNDAGVSNDLKSALQPRPKAAAAPTGPADAGSAAAPQPGSAPELNGRPSVEAPAFDIEAVPPEASLPDVGGRKADGVPARSGAPGIFLPLIGVAALVAAGGLLAARLLRARDGAPPQE